MKSVKNLYKRFFVATAALIVTVILFFLCIPITVHANTDQPQLQDYSQFTIVVDYYEEMLRIVPKQGDSTVIEVGTKEASENYKGLANAFVNDNSPKFMYALKSPSAELLASYKPEKALSTYFKEKWYPIYGKGINISNVIPKKPITDSRKTYNIAIRLADDIYETNTGYVSRISVQLKSRFYDKNLKKFIVYDEINQKFLLSSSYSSSELNIIYNVDYFSSIETKLTDNSDSIGANISVPTSIFSAGGNISIKTAPIINLYNPNVVDYASSTSVKYKIPKASTAPLVKVDSTKFALVSLKKTTTEWAITPDGPWTTYTGGTTVYYKDFGTNFVEFDGKAEGVLFERREKEPSNGDTEKYYIMYFRTKAVAGKTPASPIKTIYIPATDVDKIISQ